MQDLKSLHVYAKEVHEKVSKIVDASGITGELLREYWGKYGQYVNMIQTLDTMIGEANTDEAKDSLVNQQVVVYEKWIRYELEFTKRIPRD